MQEECVRLLLAKGADPNMQDANGNTCMHILVIRNNIVSDLTIQIYNCAFFFFNFFFLEST